MAQQSTCSHCGHERSCKGRHHIVFRTPFGKLRLESPRFYHCQCESDERTSFSPLAELLQERSSPELLYLETKFAALVSYGLTVELLQEVLPIDQELSTTAIRQRVSQTAQRLDDELGEEQDMFIGGRQRDWDRLPDPAAPLIVGIDGGYVHAKDQQSRAEGWFEVIVGKSMSQDGESSKCFGFVSRYDTKPKRRWFEMLKSQGMQMNQAVTFLSDGGDTIRDLQMYLNPHHFYPLRLRHGTECMQCLRPRKGSPPQAWATTAGGTQTLNDLFQVHLACLYRFPQLVRSLSQPIRDHQPMHR